MPETDPAQRDDAVEAGALDEGDRTDEERPPTTEEPVESGALEDES